MRTVIVLWLLATAAVGRAARADADPGSPAGAVADAPSAADAATAAKIAAAYGHPVEITSLDAESSTTYANPDGTWKQDLSSDPVRVQQAGSWVPVDLTLVRSANGAIAPKASAASITFGSGGSSTIATLWTGSGSVSYGWTSALPVPTLNGPTATYANVLPGVSLVATVSPEGVETSLVYANRQAATSAGAITLALSVSGLTAQLDAAGAVSYVDSSGTQLAQTPQPQAWDMRVGGTLTGPGGGPTEEVPSRITTAAGAVLSAPDSGAGTVTRASGPLSDRLQVPAALLSDPSTAYPLVLDPGFHQTGGEGLDGYIESDGDTEIDSSFDGGRVHVGTADGGATITRGLYQFAQGVTHNATIFAANLTVYNDYSWSCTASAMTVYKSAAFTSSVAWPGPAITSTNSVSQTFAHGYNSSCASANVVYDVTGIVGDASNDSGATNYAFELRANSETSSYGWKKFNAVAGLSIYFDHAPNPATSVGFKTAKPATPGCVSGSGRPNIDATEAMSWQARLTDVDYAYGDQIRGVYRYWDLAAPSTVYWAHTGYFDSGTVPYPYLSFAGSTTTFLDGHNYAWLVVPEDKQGVLGPYSGQCEFHVADPAPNTPTALKFASPSLACGGTMRGDQPISLTATVSDPDGKYGKAVRGDFAVTGTSWAGDSAPEVYATSGTATSPQIPANTLADGSAFTWTVKADNLSKLSAAASCTGHINDAIAAAPQVSLATGTFGASGTPNGHVGDLATLTLSDPDVTYTPTEYVWEVDPGAPLFLPLPNGCGTVVDGVHTVCSSQGAGWNQISVEAPLTQFAVSAQAYNVSGSASDIGSTTYAVNDWQPSHTWVTGDFDPTNPGADTAHVSDPVGGTPLTLGTSGLLWNSDNNDSPGVWADAAESLRFDGTGEADTGAGNPAVIDDSTHSFSVAVWLRPNASSSTTANVAVAQDGTTVSGFWIGQQNGSWQFCMADTQSLSTGQDCASVPQASGSVGAWTLVVGVWDATAQQMLLYVPSAPGSLDLIEQDAAHTTTATAAGAFTLAESLHGSESPSWNGDIIDPITFPGVVEAEQIKQLSNCGWPSDTAAFCSN
ncbi:MAG: hypothetical protein ACRDWT_01090 [Jatrophihabitantaceae bacterium]